MVKKCMLIDASHQEEIRVAVLQDSQLVDFDFEHVSKKPLKGNIYLGKIVRIEPSLQAAFVDYGRNRHGFLAFTEIHPDYFRIPVADREEIIEQEEKPAEEGVHHHETPLDEQNGHSEDSSEVMENSEETPTEESTDDTSADEESLRKKFALYRNYKIQEVINSRQVVLVQVVKEERGNKGAALTTFVSLAGRYSVLMPNALNAGGVSRKITDVQHRKRLKELMKDLGVPEGMSLIIRTAGLDRSKAEIKRDYGYLIKLWADIREETLKANAPALVHEEAALIRRSLRDVYTPDVEEVWIEGEEAFKEARDFIKTIIPSQVKRINHYKDSAKIPLFQKYKIEQQIEQIYSPEVKLPSGGYIVMNVTEALVAIDVNSGQATRERHIDSTALKTNLEAAEEISRQLRLRDLAGLLVIDFIDMSDLKHNIAVERKLKECLASDRARIQVGRISQFGLLEMSRQRLRPSVTESVSVRCSYCSGAGFIRSKESLCLQLLRVLEEVFFNKKEEEILKVKISAELGFYLLSEKRKELFDLEARRGLFFTVEQDEALGATGFRIEDSSGNFLVDSVGTKGEHKESQEKAGANKNDRARRSDRRRRKGNPNQNANGAPSPEAPVEGEGQKAPIEQTDEEVEATDVPLSNADVEPVRTEKRRNRNRRRDRRPRENNPQQQSKGATEPDEHPDDVNGNLSPDSFLQSSIQLDVPARAPRGKGQGGKGQGGWWKKLLDN
ncbi:MAG: ribonuclease E/G [Alphaproteobacteria bacterium]